MSMAYMVAMGIAFWGVVLGGGAYAVHRFLRAYERRASGESEVAALRDRVTALEEALDVMQGSVERLSAGQEFASQLLGARSGDEKRNWRQP